MNKKKKRRKLKILRMGRKFISRHKIYSEQLNVNKLEKLDELSNFLEDTFL